MTNMIRVDVNKEFDHYHYEGKLTKTIAILREALNKIPEAYRDSAQFNISYEHSYYESVEIEVEIFYYRPENADEKNERLNLEKQRRLVDLEWHKRMLNEIKIKHPELLDE